MYGDEFKYLGHEITVHPRTGQYYCQDYGFTDPTLDGLKAQIKERETVRTNRPSVNVMFEDRNEKMRKGKSTGVPARPGGMHVWVSYKNDDGEARRTQEYYGGVYLDNEQNKEMLKEIQRKRKEADKLEAEISALQDKLEVIQLVEND